MNSLVTQVLDRLVADIEAGKNPWKKSWKGGGLPSNGATKRTYRGINTLILWLEAQEKSYASQSWATFKQWAGQQRFVRKGEKGTPILFWKVLEKGEGADKTRFPMLRVSWVFNEAQLDRAAEEPQIAQPPSAEQRHARALDWSECLPLPIHAGASPAYDPLRDRIMMPPPDKFDSLDEYWATVFHEGVHWTGHGSRLKRQLFSLQADRIAYAREELVAEIGAAFMNAEFGIDTEKNNAAYLRGWLQLLPDKRDAIFTAAKQASAAFEFLTQPRQQMEAAA